MAAFGGDILEVSYKHPTVGDGIFFPKAGEDSTFDPGGFRVNDDANQVDGGGNGIYQKNRVRWSLETVLSHDMNTKGELLKLKELAQSNVEGEYTVSHSNGTVWKGKGMPVGDLQGNGNAATIQLKLAGGGEMKKISG